MNSLLPASATAAVVVAEVSFNRGHDASINDARALGSCGVCVVHGVQVQANLGHRREERGRAQERALRGQDCDILEPVRVADAVKRVDSKPDARDDARGHVERSNGREAGHVLLGGAEVLLIAAEQDVRAPVDQHDSIQIERPREMSVSLVDGDNA